ncbi:MAG TPA: response regulator [Acidobacteriaceae bacterium]|nr:response regulator [Acidobacteriaceae bacterium]
MNAGVSIPDKIKVLVVDDEHSIADTLSIILKRHGFDTATAYCGATAVEAARLWNPDVLLTDVVMPDMNGIEAAILILAAHPRCKILLFSGQAAAQEMVAARLDTECFRFLQKPIHPVELIDSLRTLVASDARTGPPLERAS